MGGSGVEVVTAHMSIDFRDSAALGDVLETSVAVEKFGNSSMTVGFTTRRQSDDTVVVDGTEVLVFVDPEHFRPVAVPDAVKATLAPESD